MKYYVGIDLGGTNIVAGLVDESYQILGKVSRKTNRPRPAEAIAADMAACALDVIKQQGLTLIPLSIYFKKGKAKMQVGLCKGKKNYDKRAVAAKKEADRTIERTMKERTQGQ